VSDDRSDSTPVRLTRPTPVRPPLTTAVRSPLEQYDIPRPRVVMLSAALWAVSCLAGVVIVAYFVWRLDAVRDLVEGAVREDDADATAATVEQAATTIVAASLGVLGLTVAARAVLTGYMAARRGWARVLLVIVGLLTAPLPAAFASLLTDGTLGSRRWLLLAIIAQEVLMLAGLVTMWLPSATHWFRTRLRPGG
jgi:hypothetical protein